MYNGPLEFESNINIDTYNAEYYSYLRSTAPGSQATVRNLNSNSNMFLEGNGTTTVTGTISKASGDWCYIGIGHTLVVAGTASWNGHMQFYGAGSGTTIVNSGAVLDFVQANFNVQGASVVGNFHNYGTVRKSSTSGYMYFQSVKFSNNANAEFHISRGLTDFNSVSSINLDPNSAFVFHIGGTVAQTNFPQVNFAFNAPTNGKVRIAFEGFTPSAGQSFRLFTYTAYTGAFTLDTVTGYAGSVSLNQTATVSFVVVVVVVMMMMMMIVVVVMMLVKLALS
jgi:hypothetical protein